MHSVVHSADRTPCSACPQIVRTRGPRCRSVTVCLTDSPRVCMRSTRTRYPMQRCARSRSPCSPCSPPRSRSSAARRAEARGRRQRCPGRSPVRRPPSSRSTRGPTRSRSRRCPRAPPCPGAWSAARRPGPGMGARAGPRRDWAPATRCATARSTSRSTSPAWCGRSRCNRAPGTCSRSTSPPRPCGPTAARRSSAGAAAASGRTRREVVVLGLGGPRLPATACASRS